MDSGGELAGAGGSHVCSLPAAHASRSFSAGGATSACLTPLTLFSLAAPPLHLRELLLGPASHRSFPSSPEDALPASCLPAPHLRQAAPLLGTLAFHLSARAPRLNTANTHTLLAASHLWRFPHSPPGHQASGAFTQPTAGGGKRAPSLSRRPAPPALCWVRGTRRPRPPQTQGSSGMPWHPRS